MNQPDIIFSDPTWQTFCRWLEGEYVDALRETAGLAITEKKADQVRGKAAFIRMLLDFEAAVNQTA